jgi:peptidoglycan/LPS O-acetylase OafA/YrhL
MSSRNYNIAAKYMVLLSVGSTALALAFAWAPGVDADERWVHWSFACALIFLICGAAATVRQRWIEWAGDQGKKRRLAAAIALLAAGTCIALLVVASLFQR